jgi:hypothetical protein
MIGLVICKIADDFYRRYLRVLAKDTSTSKEDARACFVNSEDILAKSVKILNNVETFPREIRDLQKLSISNASRQEEMYSDLAKVIGIMTGKADMILSHGKNALESAQKVREQAAKTILAVASLTANIKSLIIL